MSLNQQCRRAFLIMLRCAVTDPRTASLDSKIVHVGGSSPLDIKSRRIKMTAVERQERASQRLELHVVQVAQQIQFQSRTVIENRLNRLDEVFEAFGCAVSGQSFQKHLTDLIAKAQLRSKEIKEDKARKRAEKSAKDQSVGHRLYPPTQFDAGPKLL